MISRVPALAKIFYWAERQEVEITKELLQVAIGDGLTKDSRDGTPIDYTDSLNSAVWGFLNNCLTGDALVMLEQAEVCAGLDAWRRIIRLIDSGRNIRLEQLRNEIRSIRAYPIRNLESVTVGVAAFENKIKEYVEAGGRKPPPDEMKSDLNAILPAELGDHLIVRVSDPHQSYADFRDFVVYTCSQLLMRRKKLPINAMGGPSDEGGNDDEPTSVEQLDEWYINALSEIHTGKGGSADELDTWYLGALNNLRSKSGKGRRKGSGKGGKGGKGGGKGGGLARLNALKEGANRKCPNCHGDHMMSECRKPMLDKSQRTCFTCGGNHLAANCPNKGQSTPLKTVTDLSRIPFYNVNEGKPQVDVFGFSVVKNGAKPRPRPQAATLGMHLSNAFAALRDSGNQEEKSSPVRRPLFKSRAGKMLTTTDTPDHDSSHYGTTDTPDHYSSHYGTRTTDTPDHNSAVPPFKSHDSAVPPYHDSAVHPFKSRAGKMVTDPLDDCERLLLMEEAEIASEELNTLRETTVIKVAMDSGACRHVAHPRTMPAGVKITPNASGKHFSGAGGETIERFGDATTLGTMAGNAQVVNKWNLADVVRPLHSVAEITGPADQAKGNYDVLFNNKRCVVVQAGVVDHIMKHLAAVSEYAREGNLYTAEMVLAPFAGPDLKA